jgi:predicted phosphodiesterase
MVIARYKTWSVSIVGRPPTFAVIADLHGNLAATEAVLADLERVQPDRVIIGGDLVNRGPQSRAVVERLAPLGWEMISGNHDTWLAALARGVRLPDDWETPWWTPVRLAVADLNLEWVEWLERMPFSLRVEFPGAAPALIAHGSPRDAREGMGRMRSDEQVREALAGVEEKTVISAHIHYPYEREVDGTHVVVVGAVGCPFNRDLNAQYGLFTWNGARWACEHRSVPYDHEAVFAAWRENGFFADGSLASALMLLEYQTARTHYVPFWEWALARDLPLTFESYPAFAQDRGEPELIEVVHASLAGKRLDPSSPR